MPSPSLKFDNEDCGKNRKSDQNDNVEGVPIERVKFEYSVQCLSDAVNVYFIVDAWGSDWGNFVLVWTLMGIN